MMDAFTTKDIEYRNKKNIFLINSYVIYEISVAFKRNYKTKCFIYSEFWDIPEFTTLYSCIKGTQK